MLQTAIGASHRDISDRLDLVNEALSAFIAPVAPEKVAGPDDLAGVLARIARGLQNSYKYIRIETLKKPKDVDIDKIYIPPRLAMRATRRQRRRIDTYVKGLDHASMRELVAHAGQQGHTLRVGTSENMLSQLTYPELRSGFRRIVVLGDPGGGKSTLCQKLCSDLCKQAALGSQFKGAKQVPEDLQKVPFRLVIRSFEQALTRDPQLDILTYIVRDLVHVSSEDDFTIRGAVSLALQTGQAVVAFDGLDEILDTSKRQHFVALVDAFASKFPLAPMIVTSRLVGYDDASLPDYFDELLLERFEDGEVGEYLQKFMRVVGELDLAASKERALHFLEQTRENASDLRRNPLMLGLMSWLFLTKGDVPPNRPEIYRACAELMFERWDQNRGIVADENTDFDRAELFTYLASQIYTDPTLAAGVSREWLTRALRSQFDYLYENPAKAFSATRKFVEFITGRAWVMSEMGENVYAFTHQTFLEYFFARHLDDTHDSVTGLIDHLKQRIVKHEWNEVSHLALQIKTHGSLRRQEEAIERLSRMISVGRTQKARAAFMTFSARALQYLQPSEGVMRGFLDYLFVKAVDDDGRVDWAALTSLVEATHVAKSRQRFVREHVAGLIADALVTGSDGVMAALVFDLLTDESRYRPARGGAGTLRGTLPEEVHEMLAKRVRSQTVRKAEQSPRFAGLAYMFAGRIDPGLIKRYGLDLFFNFPPFTGLSRLDGFSSTALLAGYQHIFGFNRVMLSPEAARIALAHLGHALAQGIKLDLTKLELGRFEGVVPDGVWVQIIRTLAGEPDEVLGAIAVRRAIAQVLPDRPHLARDPEAAGSLLRLEQKILRSLRTKGIDTRAIDGVDR